MDKASTRFTVRSGTHSSSTVTASCFGVINHPLAYPSTSVDSPIARPSTVARQPEFWLCPSTNQKGSVAPVTSAVRLVLPSRTTDTCGPLAGAARATVPATARSAPASLPVPADHTSRSTSSPVSAPAPPDTTCCPASSTTVAGTPASSQPTKWAAPRRTASAVVPLSRTGTACPSTSSRSVRHSAGSAAGGATGARSPKPSSATAAGVSTSQPQSYSHVNTGRTLVIRIRNRSPVSGGTGPARPRWRPAWWCRVGRRARPVARRPGGCRRRSRWVPSAGRPRRGSDRGDRGSSPCRARRRSTTRLPP